MYKSKKVHLQIAFRAVHYLKSIPGKGIMFKRNNGLLFEAYIDADYAGWLVDRRSTTGYWTILGSNLLTWSKMLKVIARWIKIESHGSIACELMWLNTILKDLKLNRMSLWDNCNKLVISLVIKYNMIELGTLKLTDISSRKNRIIRWYAHPTCPPLQNLKICWLNGWIILDLKTIITKLGIENIYSSTLEEVLGSVYYTE